MCPPPPPPTPSTQRRHLTRCPADLPALPPVAAGALQLLPPAAYAHQPASSFAIKFAGQAPSKVGDAACVGVEAAAVAPCWQHHTVVWLLQVHAQRVRLHTSSGLCSPIPTPADAQQHQRGDVDARRPPLPHRHTGGWEAAATGVWFCLQMALHWAAAAPSRLHPVDHQNAPASMLAHLVVHRRRASSPCGAAPPSNLRPSSSRTRRRWVLGLESLGLNLRPVARDAGGQPSFIVSLLHWRWAAAPRWLAGSSCRVWAWGDELATACACCLARLQSETPVGSCSCSAALALGSGAAPTRLQAHAAAPRWTRCKSCPWMPRYSGQC